MKSYSINNFLPTDIFDKVAKVCTEKVNGFTKLHYADGYGRYGSFIEFDKDIEDIFIEKAYQFLTIDNCQVKIPLSVSERSKDYISSSYTYLEYLKEYLKKQRMLEDIDFITNLKHIVFQEVCLQNILLLQTLNSALLRKKNTMRYMFEISKKHNNVLKQEILMGYFDL
jgi:hypothetical protein